MLMVYTIETGKDCYEFYIPAKDNKELVGWLDRQGYKYSLQMRLYETPLERVKELLAGE